MLLILAADLLRKISLLVMTYDIHHRASEAVIMAKREYTSPRTAGRFPAGLLVRV